MPRYAFQLRAVATFESVRIILADLRCRLQQLGMSEGECGTIEIVLAEVLNNIVEHAYAPRCEGPVLLMVRRTRQNVRIEIRDHGRAMPDHSLPGQALPDLTCRVEELPEGGFGWALIRELSQQVTYIRKDRQNHLAVVFEAKARHTQ